MERAKKLSSLTKHALEMFSHPKMYTVLKAHRHIYQTWSLVLIIQLKKSNKKMKNVQRDDRIALSIPWPKEK